MDAIDTLIAIYECRCASSQHSAADATALASLRSARAHESMALGASVWASVREALGVAAHEPESVLADAVLRYIDEHPAKADAIEPPLDSSGLVWVPDGFCESCCEDGIADHSTQCYSLGPGDRDYETVCLVSCPVYKAYLRAKGGK